MFSNLSRRQLLRLISFLIAGTAVGSIPFLGKFFVEKAQAQAADEVYKNRRIRVVSKQTDDAPQTLQEGARTVQTQFEAPQELFIDDTRVNLIRIKGTKKYRSYLLPFTEYDSPRDLAKALIDARVTLANDPTGSRVPARQLKLDTAGY